MVTKEDGMKAVKYGNITALLVQALKEQDTIIETQQAEIVELQKGLAQTREDLESLRALVIQGSQRR